MWLIIRVAYIFYFFTSSKSTDDACLFCLRFDKQTLFAFYSLQYHVHIRHSWDYNVYKKVVVVKHHYQDCKLNAKHASTQKHLRGLGSLCSRAANN